MLRKADLFSKMFYNVSFVMDFKFCELFNVFLGSVLLKLIFNHDVLLAALHPVFVVI